MLTFTGDTAEAVLLELEAQRRRLLDEAAALTGAGVTAACRGCPTRGLVAAGTALVESIWRPCSRAVERLQAPLLADADRGAVRAGELAAELRALGGREVELRREHSEASERVAGVDVEVARLDAERAEAQRRLRAGRRPSPPRAQREELADKLERLERRREQLGGVNPFAKEEYATEKARLDRAADPARGSRAVAR